MARAIVKEIIEQFRAQFQSEGVVEVPLALRQEAPDVVFTGLLEEDRPSQPSGGPLLEGLEGLEGLAEVPPALGQAGGAPMTLDELLGAPGGAPGAAPAMSDPLAGLEDPMAGLSAPPEF